MKNPPLFLGNPSPPFLKNPSPLFRKVTPIFRKPSPSFLQTPGGFSENTYPILQKPRGLYACGGRFFCIRWGNRRGNFVGKPRRRRHFHRARIPPSPPPDSEGLHHASPYFLRFSGVCRSGRGSPVFHDVFHRVSWRTKICHKMGFEARFSPSFWGKFSHTSEKFPRCVGKTFGRWETESP